MVEKFTKRNDAPRKNLIGKVVGRLTVINFDHRRVYRTSKNNIAYWNCLCVCGNERVVSSVSLSNKAITSCGCLRKETVSTMNSTRPRNNKGLSNTLEYSLWSSAKERAKKYGRVFDLLVTDITVPDTCPVFNIKLIPGVGKQHSGSPTLDRLDSSKGYTKDNVRVISQRANALKQDATIGMLEALIKYMKGESI